MADKLTFSLVSPERELFSGDVDQVDIPGTEGDLGVFPNHSPLMAALRTGEITVFSEGEDIRYFVLGGFADVTPAGLTILAEQAMPMDELNAEMLEDMIKEAEKDIETQEGEAALATQQNLASLNVISSRFH